MAAATIPDARGQTDITEYRLFIECLGDGLGEEPGAEFLERA